MNRRTSIILFLLLISLASLVYFQSQEEGDNSGPMYDRFFAVEEKSDIHKIILTKRTGSPLVLERENGDWLVQGEREVRSNLMDNLLLGLTKVSILSQPSQSLYEKIEKDFVTFGIKVQVFNAEDENIKTYYIGSDANDGKGTYYYMEGGERFYLMGLPGFEGSMRPRFDIAESGWWKRQILDYDPSTIKEIKVNYPRQSQESFHLIHESGDQYRVDPLGDRPKITRSFSNDRVKSYLKEFRRKGLLSYVNDWALIDTVLQIPSFAELEIITHEADTQQIIFIPETDQNIQGPYSQTPYQTFEFRYYVFLPATGDFAMAQHYLWRPVFRSYDYFFEG